ncbi:MAG: glutamate synthase, partial [FCB group bacterium]|nr:glutamate synthase [FCB group bacterium]
MAIYTCSVCGYQYDEDKEGAQWSDLPADWACPICESDKSYFESAKVNTAKIGDEPIVAGSVKPSMDEFRRTSDDLETYMADINAMAESGESITEPMRTKEPVIGWDDIIVKGAQLAKMPLNDDQPVSSKTIIGSKAEFPLEIESPIYISHMSFGALSREAKIALAQGSASIRTAMCSGEGGILPESLANAHKYIFEYV